VGIDQIKDWLTKFDADGEYFHVTLPAQTSDTQAAGGQK
jgi:hypothetical protein